MLPQRQAIHDAVGKHQLIARHLRSGGNNFHFFVVYARASFKRDDGSAQACPILRKVTGETDLVCASPTQAEIKHDPRAHDHGVDISAANELDGFAPERKRSEFQVEIHNTTGTAFCHEITCLANPLNRLQEASFVDDQFEYIVEFFAIPLKLPAASLKAPLPTTMLACPSKSGVGVKAAR